MSVLVDTGVLYADHDRSTARFDAARAAMDSILDGVVGQPYLSDYVFDETVTLTRQRTERFEAAKGIGRRMLGRDPYPRTFEFVRVTEPVFERAVTTFEHYDDQSLSVTDATSIALVERHDLDGIVSFDDDFDGLVHRIDPSTL